MKRIALLLLAVASVLRVSAEDGSRLWLRYEPVQKASVSGPECIAAEELRQYYPGERVNLVLDPSMPADAYRIEGSTQTARITARNETGLLYGAYALLRGETGYSAPQWPLRILNHWDNLDGSIERGYAGKSIFWSGESPTPNPQFSTSNSQLDPKGRSTLGESSILNSQFSILIKNYARANASIGINGTVLNNVNASPKILTAPYLRQVKEIADILRPYGIKVYLSVNFASPMTLGKLKTADPLNKKVAAWWQEKAREVYALIPDFGGFLVKANSEGQPGPGDYHRTHAQGANMLADAVAPYGGIIMWRSFVYGANHKGEDRVKQAVSEFIGDDGLFRPNVILQSKNGPLDFQPREPYAPIFDNMHRTPQMAELQITQEYLGQSRHLVYLAPMWQEFFGFVQPKRLAGVAGVANIGLDKNWCGHHFSQANWYAFGRLAWNPSLTSEEIAREWLKATFDTERTETAIDPLQQVKRAVASVQLLDMMMRSREACVDYMMPLGLHHIFKFDHHYGPEPDGFKASYPLEWCPVYYHQADKQGVGFNRSHTGTDATAQYAEPYRSLYDNPQTCPEEYLLWFHHLPWNYRMRDGQTLWQSIRQHYDRGVREAEEFLRTWQEAKPFIDAQRWQETEERLRHQLDNAREWRQVCLDYFRTFAE